MLNPRDIQWISTRYTLDFRQNPQKTSGRDVYPPATSKLLPGFLEKKQNPQDIQWISCGVHCHVSMDFLQQEIDLANLTNGSSRLSVFHENCSRFTVQFLS